jgi:hypothetical protein
MCLLVGPLSDEETWAPMVPLIRQLSSHRIAQVWLHHTGHDSNRGFGTKTSQWEMDTVAMMTKKENTDDGSLLLEFRKARLRTPQTAGLFKTQLIRRDVDRWTTEPGTVKAKESAGDHTNERGSLKSITTWLATWCRRQATPRHWCARC